MLTLNNLVTEKGNNGNKLTWSLFPMKYTTKNPKALIKVPHKKFRDILPILCVLKNRSSYYIFLTQGFKLNCFSFEVLLRNIIESFNIVTPQNTKILILCQLLEIKAFTRIHIKVLAV